MTAEELCRYFDMQPHVENGTYLERHYSWAGDRRAASGSIYYYVNPTERTEFHVIDCDEYWAYVTGSALEVWLVSPEGKLTVEFLGKDIGCTPLVYVPKGTIFASRHRGTPEEGTFLSCITVPRFDYRGFRMIGQEEMQEQYPDTKAFWEQY